MLPDDYDAHAARTLDAFAIRELLDSGQISSVGLVQAYLDRIKDYDPASGDIPGICAVISVNSHALEDAGVLDQERAAGRTRGPIHGIPVLVKDIIDVAGMPTTLGRDVAANSSSSGDATVIRKLRDAGAIILAKTDPTGLVARNPFDHTKSAGFSSGGNGAGLAAGYAPIAIGECTMGSTRIPAAATSTVGFRPTTGLISMDGVHRDSSYFDTPGPMTTTVRDAAVLMDIITSSGPDHYDRGAPISTTYTKHLECLHLNHKKIGIFEPFMYASDSSICDLIRIAAQDMIDLGADLVSIGKDWIGPGETPPQITKFLSEFAGWYGMSWSPEDTKQGAATGQTATSNDREKSERELQEFRDWFVGFADSMCLDAIIYPTTRKTPQPAGALYDFKNTALAPFLSCPAVSIPAGFINNLPVGVDIMGTAPNTDSRVLGLAYAFEQATKHRRTPDMTCWLDAG